VARKAPRTEAHLAEADDEGPALLMASVCALHGAQPEAVEPEEEARDAPSPTTPTPAPSTQELAPSTRATTEEEQQGIFLDESRVQVNLGAVGGAAD